MDAVDKLKPSKAAMKSIKSLEKLEIAYDEFKEMMIGLSAGDSKKSEAVRELFEKLDDMAKLNK